MKELNLAHLYKSVFLFSIIVLSHIKELATIGFFVRFFNIFIHKSLYRLKEYSIQSTIAPDSYRGRDTELRFTTNGTSRKSGDTKGTEHQ